MMLHRCLSLAVVILAAPAFADAPALPSPKPVTKAVVLTGQYLEARSAAVYAGACHYNGELTTAGREAVMAWKVTGGKGDGKKFVGLSAIALVSGNENLANGTARRSTLLIDARATPAQRDALVGWVLSRAGATLGPIVAIRSLPIQFKTDGLTTTIRAGEQVTLDVEKYPCSHCLMPVQTWYQPLAPGVKAEVAQGTRTSYTDDTLQVSWSQAGSDNCFVGTF